MKRKTGLFIVFFWLTLCMMMPLPVLADDPQTPEEQETQEEVHADGWDSGKYYKNGQAVTGLVTIDGRRYYFNASGKQKTGWQKIEGKRYYFNKKAEAKGYAVTGFATIGKKIYLFSDKGVQKTGWQKVKDKVYYFNKKANTGEAVTGQKKLDGKRYYFSKKGVLQTGWKKIDGKRYYFRTDGKLGKLGSTLSGLQKVGDKYYYFKSDGTARTGWIKIKGKKSYFNAKGERVSGKQKIDKKWYFFDKNGIRCTETTKESGTTYFINSKGYLEAYKAKGKYYKPDGKKMDAYETLDYETLNRAREIVAKITNDKMSMAQKMQTCFKWVMKKPYVVRRRFRPLKTWPATYANDHFVKGGGDCHADGAAFAYLARALGYKDSEVYVCLDCNGQRHQGHCWAEIKGKVYDPLFAEAKSYRKNYGVSYKTYRLSPILHLKIAVGYE